MFGYDIHGCVTWFDSHDVIDLVCFNSIKDMRTGGVFCGLV